MKRSDEKSAFNGGTMTRGNLSVVASLFFVLFLCPQSQLKQRFAVQAFTIRTLSIRQQYRRHSTAVYYQNDDSNDNGRTTRNSIPVLGPLPGHSPLGLGAEMTLEEPTDLQWQALEETVHIHEQHCQADNSTAGVSAAPLIALLDDYTKANLPGVPSTGAGRYATVAAVVGLSSCSSSDDDDLCEWDDNNSFMESLYSGDRRRVRLVGVGRAVVTDFHYQVPSSHSYDEDGHLLNEQGQRVSDTPTTTEQDDLSSSQDDKLPSIIMANFRLIEDQTYGSPVHALSTMSQWAFKLQSLHEVRRKLVAGLQAGQARLAAAEQKMVEEVLYDHDGIGALFAAKEAAQSQSASSSEENAQTDTASLQDTSGESVVPDVPPATTSPDKTSSSSATTPEAASNQNSTEITSSVAQLDNYGLGSSAASFSTVRGLTSFWVEKLQPYYSPERSSSEEHYYEVLSFVSSVICLDTYLNPTQVGWSLRCCDTVARMKQTYEWMWNHVLDLKQEVERVSECLRSCGEECADLW